MTTELPRIVVIIAWLLIAIAGLGAFGVIADHGQMSPRIYAGVGVLAMLTTGILLLVNTRWALPFGFVTALLLTADQSQALLAATDHELPRAFGRFLFNVALYWAGYVAYLRWRLNLVRETEIR